LNLLNNCDWIIGTEAVKEISKIIFLNRNGMLSKKKSAVIPERKMMEDTVWSTIIPFAFCSFISSGVNLNLLKEFLNKIKRDMKIMIKIKY
jgi:hypothetical protein